MPEVTPEAFDGCSSLQIAQEPAEGAALALGAPVSVTLTVTDGAGNTISDTVQVELVDAEPPVVTLPEAFDVPFDTSCAAAVPDVVAAAEVTDNCPLPQDFEPTATVTAGAALTLGTPVPGELTAVDAAGNNTTVAFVVQGVDTLPPQIVLAAPDVTVPADASCSGAVPVLGATVTDNCDAEPALVQLPAAGEALTFGVPATVTLEAKDAAGTAAVVTATVTLADQTPPVVQSIAPIAVAADATCSGVVPTVAPAATDNCGAVSASAQAPAVGQALALGDTTGSVTISDAAGNTTVAAFTVVLSDTTPPTVDALADSDVTADAACAGVVGDLTTGLGYADNCPGAAIAQAPDPATALTLDVPTPITVTVTDAAGLTATTTANRTLRDETAPSVTFEGTVLVPANEFCEGLLPQLLGRATVSDNCAPLAALADSQEPVAGTLLTKDTAGPATLTVLDPSGNSTTATADIALGFPEGACGDNPDNPEAPDTGPDSDVEDNPAEPKDDLATDTPGDGDDLGPGGEDVTASGDTSTADGTDGSTVEGGELPAVSNGCGCRHAGEPLQDGGLAGLLLSALALCTFRRPNSRTPSRR